MLKLTPKLLDHATTLTNTLRIVCGNYALEVLFLPKLRALLNEHPVKYGTQLLISELSSVTNVTDLQLTDWLRLLKRRASRPEFKSVDGDYWVSVIAELYSNNKGVFDTAISTTYFEKQSIDTIFSLSTYAEKSQQYSALPINIKQLIDNGDWHYHFSDSANVFRNGEARLKALTDLIGDDKALTKLVGQYAKETLGEYSAISGL